MRNLGIWQVAKGSLSRVPTGHLDLEKHLEDWIVEDPALLRSGVIIVGRQIALECGPLDLLGLDPQGRWVVVEIKRGSVDRKTVAQVVDYAACIAELSADELRAKIAPYLESKQLDIDELLEQRGATEGLDPQQRELLLFVVGTDKSPGLERVIRFLAGTHSMPISVVMLDVFQLDAGRLLLAREVTEEESASLPDRPSSIVTAASVMALAKKYGTDEQLRRAMKLAERMGLRLRPWKTSLMFTPPSNGTRMLFTLWAKPERKGLKAYVGVEPFHEFFSLEPKHVEKLIGPEGWRVMNTSEYNRFLKGLESLGISGGAPA